MARYRFANCELDTETFDVRRDGEPQGLEPQVFDVLLYLLLNRDRVVTREELLDSVWGDRFVSLSALTSRIKSARSVCGDTGREQRIIRTLHGRGYRFVAEVDATEGPDGSAVATETPSVTRPGPSVGAPVTRYAMSGGRATAYQVIGDGDDALVFVPGFVSNVELNWDTPPFADFFARLGAGHRLIVFDKLGTGLSDRLGQDEVVTLEERMADLEVVMDAVGVERAAMFGISEGGAMAALMAATRPHRVSKLILANSYARLDWVEPDVIEEFLQRMERDWGSGSMIGGFLAPSWHGDAELRRLCARYERHSATPATAANYLRLSLHHLDVTDVLPAVQAPTLVLHRRDDRLVAVSAGTVLADRIPHAELRILPGSDHLVFAGNTDDILEPTAQFLADRSIIPAPSRSVLATLMFAEVVEPGDGDGAPQPQRIADFARRANDIIRRFDGSLVERSDDRMLATFAGPARAARAALELRDVVRTLGVDLRAGVHTAEVDVGEGGVEGVGVQVGRRIGDLASPGEVWVSRTVRDLTAGSGLTFDERGRHRLLDVDEPWNVFAVDG